MVETETKAAGPSANAASATLTEGKAKRRPRNRSGKAAKKETEPKQKAEIKAAAEVNESKGKHAKRAKSKQNKSKKETSHDDANRSDGFPKVRLKVVVRRLPPNLPEDVFWKAISPWATREDAIVSQESGSNASSSIDNRIEQGYYVQGKMKDSKRRTGTRTDAGVQHTLSRAYLRFRSTEALLNFHKGFDGHLFRDAKGTEHVAVVELAPFQRMLNDAAGKRKRTDALEGTIEADNEYKAFVESLQESDISKGGEQMSAEKTDAQLMAHLTSLHEANQLNKNVKSTPLLDHLRRQRIVKAEAAAMKNAKKYLNKNHGAYAATTTPKAGKTIDSSVRKSKGKAKEKEKKATGGPIQQVDPAIPTGPKALRKGKNEAGLQSAAKTGPVERGRNVSGDGKKKSGAEKQVAKNVTSKTKEIKGASGPTKTVDEEAKRIAVTNVEFNPPTGPSMAADKAGRPPRRSKGPRGDRPAGEVKAGTAS